MRLNSIKKANGNGNTLAVIDIGSNSIRMVIGQLLPDGTLETLEQLQRTVHLGQDTFRRGGLGRMVMRAAILIIREYLQILKLYNVKNIWAVATSAVREAANSEIFIDRVLTATGLEIHLISTTEESSLTVTAVRNDLDNRTNIFTGNTLIAEVGGGSTILTVLRNGKIINSQSLNLGAIRLQEMFTTGSESKDLAVQIIEKEIITILEAVQSVIPFEKIQRFVAIGGDVRFAASVTASKTKEGRLVSISHNKLEKLIEKIKTKSTEQLVSKYGLSISEAETIGTALIVYEAMLRKTKTETLLVSNISMRDGLLLELAQRATGKVDKMLVQGVLESARAIAEKYKVNLKHALQLELISTKLFDELAAEYSLNNRHRLLLKAAAILHEVGIYISGRAYHKHTFYLIANSEIFGLAQGEVQMVAHIARYHRKSRPKVSHIEYMSLPREKRIIVNKLASILRMADALKITSEKQIRSVKFKTTKDNLLISIPERSDIILRKKALEIKSDMFEDIYGLWPLIQES